jgi:hypothetical protein
MPSSFMALISIIINQNWISFAQCSMMQLSPLFSSKEIDFSPLHERAFFYPAFSCTMGA